jgi:hypothetical protein
MKSSLKNNPMPKLNNKGEKTFDHIDSDVSKNMTKSLTECVLICEGRMEADEETIIQCWQELIDTGVVWTLQGSFGRRSLIDSGDCHR